MKTSELKRWLAKQGVDFVEGSRHTRLYYKGNKSVLPRHQSTEMKEPTRKAILKQLGLTEQP